MQLQQKSRFSEFRRGGAEAPHVLFGLALRRCTVLPSIISCHQLPDVRATFVLVVLPLALSVNVFCLSCCSVSASCRSYPRALASPLSCPRRGPLGMWLLWASGRPPLLTPQPLYSLVRHVDVQDLQRRDCGRLRRAPHHGAWTRRVARSDERVPLARLPRRLLVFYLRCY